MAALPAVIPHHAAAQQPSPVDTPHVDVNSANVNRTVSPVEQSPAQDGEPVRKKQKRNKPTLSCEECVDKKTKCDRGRPHCLACIKRQSECHYALAAILIQEKALSSGTGKRMTKPPKARSVPAPQSPVVKTGDVAPQGRRMSKTSSTTSSLTGLFSHIPYSHPSASNVFGIGSEHPFANYWTCQGGVAEVLQVLPEKLKADILLERYFECFDPVYPMIHRQTFFADYEHFWSLPLEDRARADASMIGLIFAILATGTQFLPTGGTKNTAEFYVSASHQALRLFSYLNKTSIRSIQTMVLITYFLINDNHASDGWAFAGVLMRQAYAMGLNRDPKIVARDASVFEQQQRRKLWQAVLLQDTFLTVLLSLPPTATHTDVDVASLIDDSFSIASAAPTDTSYMRGCWSLANLVQESICSPRSLDLPICTTARQKVKLISDFKFVYRSLPDVFRSWDAASLTHMAEINKRLLRQILFITSNYWHNIMLVHASESAEVPIDEKKILEAAHEAIAAFFLMNKILPQEARVWWVFNHRAFLEAMCIGNVLRDYSDREDDVEAAAAVFGHSREALFAKARQDIVMMIEILRDLTITGHDNSEVARTRVGVLSEYLQYGKLRAGSGLTAGETHEH